MNKQVSRRDFLNQLGVTVGAAAGAGAAAGYVAGPRLAQAAAPKGEWVGSQSQIGAPKQYCRVL